MEWRCEWCGKPHEENDPPCDNCGHGKFEEAVVRQTDLASDDGPETTLVWVCTDCGREHPKNAPPCSRCGNTKLEKQRQRVDDEDLSAPGYLDLVTPRYLAAVSVVLLAAVVFVLGYTGVVDVPGIDQGGVPDVEDVPGNATTAGEIDLAAVEESYVTTLNERLQQQGDQGLQRSTTLDEIATWINQESVKAQSTGRVDIDGERLRDLLFDECRTINSDTAQQVLFVNVTGEETPEQVGERVATRMLENSQFGPADTENTLGVDVHYLDGELYVRQFVCTK
jgi:hypothetical protein